MIEVCHDNGLPVIYHGCGNVKRIFKDFIEMGLGAPLGPPDLQVHLVPDGPFEIVRASQFVEPHVHTNKPVPVDKLLYTQPLV